MTIQKTLKTFCFLLFSVCNVTYTHNDSDENVYYDTYKRALNTLTEIDDIIQKTKYTLSKLEQLGTIAQNKLELPAQLLQGLRMHGKKLIEITQAAETLLMQEESLGESDPKVAIIALKKIMHDSKEKSYQLFSDLIKTQEQIKISLPHLSLAICACSRQKLHVIRPNYTAHHDLLAHFSRAGIELTLGLKKYQDKRQAVTELESIYAYFFDAKEMSHHFTPMMKWTDQAIEITQRMYEQYTSKSLTVQQELVDETKDITEKFKRYNTISERNSKPNITELTDTLEKSKLMVAEFFETKELQQAHFVTKATVTAIERAKRDSEREIETLQSIIEKVEKKKEVTLVVSHAHNAVQIITEAKKCPFFIILSAMAGSYSQVNQQKTISKLIYLGSSMTDKVPLAKAGKINSKKGILAAPILFVETANEKINVMTDHTLPPQLWTDKHGNYYISDKEKDKEYAYQLTQIMAIQVPKKNSASEQTTQPKV